MTNLDARGKRDAIRTLLPWDGLARGAAARAIELIPVRLLDDYLARMSGLGGSPGFAHELRLLGELSSRDIPNFRCRPFDPSTNCDAVLEAAGTEIELEITALVEPAHAAAVTRVCARLNEHLRNRFPQLFFRVELSNLFLDFPSKPVKGGSTALDEDTLYHACVEDLKLAIDRDGVPVPSWGGHSLRRPVQSVVAHGFSECRQTGYSLPGGTDVHQVERKVLGKIREPQWTGSRPVVLAVVLDYWPQGGLLDRHYHDVSAAAFAESDLLCGIAEVPCSASSSCRVIWPASAQGLANISAEARDILTEAFDFTYEHSLLEP